MTIVLYDLCGREGRRFSPYCWRAKLALAHKGVPFETRPTRFTEIPAIEGGGQKTVPVIVDGGRVVADSFAIALYLEEAYPSRPSLFGGDGGRALARFVEAWANALHSQIISFVVADIHERLSDEDKVYFRESRERRFGQRLEDFQRGREQRLESFRGSLVPLRTLLDRQKFIGGDAPLFADYIVCGSLQWPRVMSPFRLLADNDPVKDWFARCLALYGGIGAAEKAAA
jgi:glutathione S-transferase